MIILILFFLFCLFYFCVPLRVSLFNLPYTIYYTFYDLFYYFRYRSWRNARQIGLICFVGLFGKGKTLSSVHYVTEYYHKYNDRVVYDRTRQKWVTQKVNVLSNVSLSIPYKDFFSLKQLVAVSEMLKDYDLDHDTLTYTVVLGDEFSVQLNSRNFKSNIDPLFLNTLLTSRHHRISCICYDAQRFNQVDALLRQVTSYVISCNKIFRIMVHKKYDAWEMENATNPELVKPRLIYGWFVRNKDYDAYDTYACVENLKKSCLDGDMITENEILVNQGNSPENVNIFRKTRKARKSLK